MKIIPIPTPILIEDNNQTNEARQSSTEQCQNWKMSLEESKDSVLIASSNNVRGSKEESGLITDQASPSKIERIDCEDDYVIFDMCVAIGLKPNARIEVKWSIIMIRSNILERETRWWGAKLLPHDGRMRTLFEVDGLGDDPVTVPIRVLDYDPYVSGGFHERSTAEVVFLNDHLLYEMATDTYLSFRTEGSAWEDEDLDATGNTVTSVSCNGLKEYELRETFEVMLQSALISSGHLRKMKTLSAAQQYVMTEYIGIAKETLFENMIERINGESDGVITGDCVRKCVHEMERLWHCILRSM
eukprot:CAMPEP_0172479224 /NCGR_PEP_ID=MMETSP1066-20121228/3683_1 /TAXON_ID=671091 /ORGANISM="Coscinodiscus wailesii, Strain CCMP2513" /LENGTH=300 /DNA_ID=CAMNT_0013239501 /DNA_START=272 /DNA_END=1174 /DNA_ORIENTATION=+